MPCLQSVQNVSQVPAWVGTLLVGGYICVAGQFVLQGALGLGEFIATVKIFKEVGDTFNKVTESARACRYYMYSVSGYRYRSLNILDVQIGGLFGCTKFAVPVVLLGW